MRALLFHCKEYKTELGRMANRPKGIKPEKVKERFQDRKDCIVSLVTIEKGDKPEAVATELENEIRKMSAEVGHTNIVLVPFAHLSYNLGSEEESIKILDLIQKKLRVDKFNVTRAHFGSHKSLLLNIYGHPGNARYREF